ncbi:MAG TPA: hypothetical protein PKD49_06365 [Hyphomicrobium sp.]|nr:hypothetical protein [Hyphomicrobium sp.]
MPVLNAVLFHILAIAVSLLFVAPAHAVSDEVRSACERDYSAYCGHHQVGSESLRSCMRENSKRLSPGCRHALVTSGEASPQDIRRYKGEMAKGAR